MDETWANSNKKMVALQAEGWGHSTDSTASFHLSSNNYGPVTGCWRHTKSCAVVIRTATHHPISRSSSRGL